ncbi:MAG: tetratricopeptide repeat protein [Alphaproteobacteria bacterium]|nr:tetratricopeptide repeat protein [Alphaproteobacteria bacterium]
MRRLAPVALLLALAACVPEGETPGQAPGQAAVAPEAVLVKRPSGVEAYVAADFAKRPPARIAVLPFEWPASDVEPLLKAEGEHAITQTFRNFFFGLPYASVPPTALQETLVRFDMPPHRAVPLARRGEIAKAVGADTVLIGTVLNYDKIFAGVYGQLAAGVDVSLVRVEDGATLFRARHTVRHHKGGVPFTPVEAITTLLGTALEITDKARLATLDEMTRDVVAEVPIHGGGQAARAATIVAARHNAAGKILKAGDEVKFAMGTTREVQGRVQIGKDIAVNLVPANPPKADQTFLYEGSYRFKKGEDQAGQLAAFVAFDEVGRRIEYVDPDAALHVDTIPPDAPAALRARFLEGKIVVAWKAPAAPDLALFDVMRSPTPRSGFTKIGETEFETFTDPKPLATTAYYQIIARDKAGNRSDPSPTAEGRRVPPGPTNVTGQIQRDTAWYAEGSPYILSGETVVHGAATLSLEPGVVVVAKAGARLVVDGRLLADGGKDGAISWEGDKGARWGGLRIRNAGADRQSTVVNNRFADAETALDIVAASPIIETSTFNRNDVAIRISDGTSDPKLRGNTLRNNRVGFLVEGADVAISGNIVRFNQDAGVEIVAASPQLAGNDLSDNPGAAVRVRDQARRGAFVAERNWWGTVEADMVRSMVKGAVAFEPVLDAAPPAGKPVKAREKAPTQVAAATPAPAQPPADAQAALARLQNAYKAMEEGRAAEALPALKEVAAGAPRNADLQYRIALAEMQSGRLADARASIDRAIGVNAFSPHFHLTRGLILKDSGDAAGAEAAFRKVLELNPRDRTAARLLGGGAS